MATPGLGDLARDTITGFEGVVVARTEWLMGCDRITLQPRSLDKDGKPIEAQTFDAPYCEVSQADAVPRQGDIVGEPPAPARTGGPRSDPGRGR